MGSPRCVLHGVKRKSAWGFVKQKLSGVMQGELIETVTLKVRAADQSLGDQDLLSEAEHERLANMHQGARPAFVTARTMLRAALGDYMGLLPSAVPLVQPKKGGRIQIEGFRESEPPFFSISHTGGAEEGIAAVAVSASGPIGIDIQQLDPIVDWARVAERRFPESEWAVLSAMPDTEAAMLFFTLWAVKESFVKMENGTLMPYLRGVELDLKDNKFVLQRPTPGGTESATIYFHYIPESYLVITLVSQSQVEVELDYNVAHLARRADPLQTSATTDEDAA